MLKSQTKLTALNAHIIIRSLAGHSLGLDHVHVLMFAACNLCLQCLVTVPESQEYGKIQIM